MFCIKTFATLSALSMNSTNKKLEISFAEINKLVCKKLQGLSQHLTYHDMAHTLDVVYHSERIAKEEGIENENDIFLIKVAALYHDTGFLNVYSKHEQESCEIFLRDAKNFHFTKAEKEFVNRLIMATQLPQEPSNIFEMVICDADLDYLGRPDFFSIGDALRREFLHYGIVSSNEAWEKLQIKFLTAHQYHTQTSQRVREAEKQKHIASLL